MFTAQFEPLNRAFQAKVSAKKLQSQPGRDVDARCAYQRD
jgi:hypothetical protein